MWCLAVLWCYCCVQYSFIPSVITLQFCPSYVALRFLVNTCCIVAACLLLAVSDLLQLPVHSVTNMLFFMILLDLLYVFNDCLCTLYHVVIFQHIIPAIEVCLFVVLNVWYV